MKIYAKEQIEKFRSVLAAVEQSGDAFSIESDHCKSSTPSP